MLGNSSLRLTLGELSSVFPSLAMPVGRSILLAALLQMLTWGTVLFQHYSAVGGNASDSPAWEWTSRRVGTHLRAPRSGVGSGAGPDQARAEQNQEKFKIQDYMLHGEHIPWPAQLSSSARPPSPLSFPVLVGVQQPPASAHPFSSK